jgi:diguanylate cyclase (GGDEF)-like protein/PAS domain S-box-containing protein
MFVSGFFANSDAITMIPDYLRLVIGAPESSLLLVGRYNPVLVGLSVVIAIFASYAAFLVSACVMTALSAAARCSWLMAGGFCMGLGIWAMHFVGMLAFTLPCVSSYEYSITLLSMIPGILASALALNVISRRELSRMRLAVGGLLLGAGIGVMHYSGMAAMRFDGLIRYDLRLFLLSVAVAILLATLALWTKFRISSYSSRWHRAAPAISAIVMGVAVAGMHYTAMAAAYFIRDGDSTIVDSQIGSTFIAAIVLSATGVIIAVTVVATYVRKRKLLSFRRSYKMLGLLIVGWNVLASLSADYIHDRLLDDAYRQESQRSSQAAATIAHNIGEQLAMLKAIVSVFARDGQVRSTMRGLGADTIPSAIDQGQRKQLSTQDERLATLNEVLAATAVDLNVDALWVLNATGDCIAASNAGEPNSVVGINYADRDYFLQAKAGQKGSQYAMGRVSRIGGLFFSYPIIEKGRFLGAVVVTRNISKLADWSSQTMPIIADANGVIVFASDKALEFRTLPKASVMALPIDKQLLQYGRNHFEPLAVMPWGHRRFPAAVSLGGAETPVALASATIADAAIVVYVPHSLAELVRLSTQIFWLFLLIAFAGSMLIIAASAVVLYLRETQKVEADLRIAAIAFESQEGMVITDATNVILRINRAFTEITGYTTGEVVGRTLSMFDSGLHDEDFYAGMWTAIHREGAWHGEIWRRRKNGESYPELLTVTSVKDAAANVTHYVCVSTDITLRKASEEEIRCLALYDFLTSLPNRRCLMERLHHALTLSARNRRWGALLFIDLDNFKDLNDTLGHNIGDLLLQQVAKRAVACVRESDTVARLGGDEFVILLENLSGNAQEAAEQVRIVGENILIELDQPYLLGTHQHHCTSSIGATLFVGEAQDVESLLRQTDLAMYQAKAAGRNTLRFFNPSMQAAVTARAALHADLRQGLRHAQFQLYYQPQVDGAGHFTGAEALLRWRHPQRGMVAPAEFVSAAEESGLILPLGNWVLATACAQLAAWSVHPETAGLSIAVNVSPRQFRQPDFVDQVLALLADSGAAAHRLKLELTENLLLDDVEATIATMVALTSHGVEFSLDDFGTGYSSLAYLNRLPIYQLKIDRSFVCNMLSSPSSATITKTIITLAHGMGLSAIAEGVETAAQRDFLVSLGCEAFQGYLFGKPLPLQEFEQLLDQAARRRSLLARSGKRPVCLNAISSF